MINFVFPISGCAFSGRPLAVVIGNFGGLLERIPMVAHGASGNKIDNIMIVRELKNLCAIKYHSGSPITIGNLI